VPALTQILMAEDVPLRLVLVDMLAEIDSRAATIALACRAIFDLSPEVRQAAIDALQERPRDQARGYFVAAMRYPWPPAADHAADALIALRDTEVIPLLVAQLGKPDPTAPRASTQGGAVVRELVKINHEANCLLCHAPAQGGRDPVVGVDPVWVPQPPATNEPGGYGRPRIPNYNSKPMLIRADVQFLRQDFSVRFPKGYPYNEVENLRFDFVVRTRHLKGYELQEWKKKTKPEAATFPQRESTLYALRALTGLDLGPKTDDWLKQFPSANAEAEGFRISAVLQQTLPDQREPLLAKYRDSRDEHFTEGLASAIPHLHGKLQARVREVLVERLLRLPADQLRAYLEDEDEETHRAAALACIRKADKEWIPDMIALLLDEEPAVADAAHSMLRQLSGEDFGPTADATPEQRIAAVAKWQSWRRNQADE
jgi:hypothetical protein